MLLLTRYRGCFLLNLWISNLSTYLRLEGHYWSTLRRDTYRTKNLSYQQIFSTSWKGADMKCRKMPFQCKILNKIWITNKLEIQRFNKNKVTTKFLSINKSNINSN